MFKLSIGSVTVALLFAPNILAAVPAWGQCGGINHTGDTNCESGLSCVFLNDWFSQCTPGANIATTSSSVNAPVPSSVDAPVPTESSPPPSNSGSGFVKTSGTSFTLDGANYAVVGSNSYMVGLDGYSLADMNQVFADIAGTGATVVRTWGFNEVTSPTRIFYQSWSGSTPTINTGATGLQNFDKVVSLAKSNGLKLIVALTNNWQDFGGMDVYVKQILNSDQHDLFYTDVTVKNAYKDYVKAFVGRYVNEPGIMAWELVNEPRCTGATKASTGTCTTATITEWIKEMSAFVKSLDSNHLVAVGDEGFYNDPGNAAYPYQGGEGVDFDVNLAIPTIDFGTFHSYPTHWNQAANAQAFGTQWITDHAKSQQKANKPVILEEFGVEDDQRTVYQAWLNEVVNSGLAGNLIWQAGSHLSQGDTHNDDYAVFPEGDVYALLKTTSAEFKSARA